MFEKIKNFFKKWFSNNDKQQIFDLIAKSPQKGRDMQIIGREHIDAEVVKFVQKGNYRIAVEKLSPQIAEQLGFKYPNDVHRTLDAYEINHTLNKHGKYSNNVKFSGQPSIDENDIAHYTEIADKSDEKLDNMTEQNLSMVMSFTQVNGYHIVVEELRIKVNELSFKSMYKGNGDYHNSKAYKEALEYMKSSARATFQGYEPGVNSNADNSKSNPITKIQTSQEQNSKKFSEMSESEKEAFIKERKKRANDWQETQDKFLSSKKAKSNKTTAQKADTRTLKDKNKLNIRKNK